jgi:hypothetical protein
MKTYEIKEEVLQTVTKEKNSFSYVSKVKQHFNNAFNILDVNIKDIKSKIVFSADNKSIQIDDNLFKDLEKTLNKVNMEDKRLISHCITSLNNVLFGKNTVKNSVW